MMTLPELFAAFDAAKRVQRQSFQVATLAAWQVARLMRTDPKKRLPKLARLFDEFADRNQPQSRKQLAGVLASLSQQYGIPLRQVAAHG